MPIFNLKSVSGENNKTHRFVLLLRGEYILRPIAHTAQSATEMKYTKIPVICKLYC